MSRACRARTIAFDLYGTLVQSSRHGEPPPIAVGEAAGLFTELWSPFSASKAPVGCDAVKNQQQAGFSDAKIASDLGVTVDQVSACHGPKTALGPRISKDFLGVDPEGISIEPTRSPNMTVRSRRTPPESLEPAAPIKLDTFRVLPPDQGLISRSTIRLREFSGLRKPCN